MCRSPDGIVYVGYNIYSDGSSYSTNRNVKFSFEAEFAMLYPVALLLQVKSSDSEMIECVWNSAYYEAFGESFDRLRAEATSKTSSFTEDEINQVIQALREFFEQDIAVSVITEV